MKNILIAIVSILVITSCKKSSEVDGKPYSDLHGTWRLVSVYDKVDTGLVAVAKPTGVTGDILITFSNGKSYRAKTFTRTYNGGKYSIENNNEIDFDYSAFSGGSDESEWGMAFAVMLTSCGLQSVFPCVRNTIVLNNDQLSVNTVLRYNLVFEKVD